MKIRKLKAEQVHGYLPIEVEFCDDVTFLTGLNGSGKTSALRLLMALLTPNLEELGAIDYSAATVTVEDKRKEITVSAERTPEQIVLNLSTFPEHSLIITSAELELLQEVKRREEHRSPVMEKYASDLIYKSLREMSTPMFLGLDRRFFVPGTVNDDTMEVRRRDYMARRYWPDDLSSRNTSVVASLMDVNYLMITKMQEIRASQEQLDERLRTQFFAKAFEYNHSTLFGNLDKIQHFPSQMELNKYRGQLAKIERAAGSTRIPIPEIQAVLANFFERMNRLVIAFNDHPNKQQKDRKRSKEKASSEDSGQNYIEWIINKPQVDRIVEHLGLLEKYIEDRDALRDPIERFLNLVNGFFAQTNKKVEVTPSGQLTVIVKEGDPPRPISALSSGERQLLVMLAHLSINPSLTGSGVFMVDEPELSLHIDWQEKFVDAVQKANPKVQLVLATHSPAIILDRDEFCRSLS